MLKKQQFGRKDWVKIKPTHLDQAILILSRLKQWQQQMHQWFLIQVQAKAFATPWMKGHLNQYSFIVQQLKVICHNIYMEIHGQQSICKDTAQGFMCMKPLHKP